MKKFFNTKLTCRLLGLCLFASLFGLMSCSSFISDLNNGGASSITYYTITFNANGDSLTTTTQKVAEGTATALKSASELGATLSGYIFSSWSTTSGGTFCYTYSGSDTIDAVAWYMARGGGWSSLAFFCEVCYRSKDYSYDRGYSLGFRVVRNAE